MAAKYAKDGYGTVHLLRYLKSLSGYVKAITWRDGGQKGSNKIHSKFMTFVSIPMAFKAPLANDFSKGYKKLQPIIFSHAEASDRMFYSGLLRELAS